MKHPTPPTAEWGVCRLQAFGIRLFDFDRAREDADLYLSWSSVPTEACAGFAGKKKICMMIFYTFARQTKQKKEALWQQWS